MARPERRAFVAEEVITMSTIDATSKTAVRGSSDSAPESKTLHVFLTRGIIAIA